MHLVIASPMNYSFWYLVAVSKCLKPTLTAVIKLDGSVILEVPKPIIGISYPELNFNVV